MKITYRILGALILLMEEDQLDSDVTVEIVEENGTECFPAELRIADSEHDSLDEGHPVIFTNPYSCNLVNTETIQTNDLKTIALQIGLKWTLNKSNEQE